MQNGCLMLAPRRPGPNVWEFRWGESGSDGRRVHRRIVIGTVEQFESEARAAGAVVALRREINGHLDRMCPRLLTLSQLVEHYKQRELAPDNAWKSYSTIATYRGYLRKWIVPRRGTYTLASVRPIEVESWLRTLRLAKSSCAKIRNLMSVLFNHARRYDLSNGNPISLVRKSAKRQKIPEVLAVDELRRLLQALGPRDRTDLPYFPIR